MTDLLMKKEVNQYLKQVERLLVAPRAERKRLIEALCSDMEDYAENHPGADMDELYAHFGTPQKIADEMLAAQPPAKLRRYVRRHSWAKALLILLVVVVLGAGLVVAIERICYAANGNPIVLVGEAAEVNSFPESTSNDTGIVWKNEPQIQSESVSK